MNFYKLCTLLSYLPTELDAIEFIWRKDDKRFDFIVGITVDHKPIGIGSWISPQVVVTSANPLESYLTKTQGSKETEYYDPEKKVELHYMMEGKSTEMGIAGFGTYVSNRNETWVKMGFDRTHSPIHDLIFITIEDTLRPRYFPDGRYYFHLSKQVPDFRNGWTFAGFGYVDDEHVKNGTLLEIHQYEDEDEEDCDEWIPRSWGRFICLSNVDNLIAVQSGAPLMHNGQLRGVGSFALKKGKESIIVFTDFSLYRMYMDAYIFMPTTTTKRPTKKHLFRTYKGN